MDWKRVLNRLESDVIKTDVMASTDADFMATHMPFHNLSLMYYGQSQGQTERISEEDLYQDYIINPQNRHVLMIVRGSNGAGKSHLIRWLKSRFVSDSEAYEPLKERVVFIRRLGNTLRGAVDQLLKERVVQDPQVEERMRNFVAAADTQDESHFKSTIYYSFIAEIENDRDDTTYTPAERRDIVAFFSDSRVKDVLMAGNGPISRCYALIVKPKDVVFGGEAAFVVQDFALERTIIREIKNDGATEARRFLNRLDNEVEVLVQYLNRFTSGVVRRCANISQGDTREIFAQLRRELRKQGKNLTIFIEDFTAFTGVDAELITVLSTEHGGANDDFCRVTAVIGITNAYYDQFRDNFKDRVTHQVEVGEEAYGSREALTTMASLYLNAAFCTREEIEQWYANGADSTDVPQAVVPVPMAWETIVVGRRKFTLYPFNSRALVKLFQSLPDKQKTPREFLRRVVLVQLGAYLRDQRDGKVTRFPDSSNLSVADLTLTQVTHATYIDDQVDLTGAGKRRLRTLLCIWGEGHAAVGEQDGVATIGGLPAALFTELGFASFRGLGGKTAPPSEPGSEPRPEPGLDPRLGPGPGPGQKPKKLQQHEERRADIEGWYQNKDSLRYSADARKWLKEFIAYAVSWQTEGIAGHLAKNNLDNNNLIYIEGQQQEGSREKAAVVIERTAEHRDVLMAMAMYQYYEQSWSFMEAPYFQLQLIGWLERVKPSLLKAVRGGATEREWPMFKWDLTAEYLRLGVMGYLKTADQFDELRMALFNRDNLSTLPAIAHDDGKWKSVQTYLMGNHVRQDFETNKDMLIQFKNTYLGFVNQAGGSTYFFDLDAVFATIQTLQKNNWDIQGELPDVGSDQRTFSTLSLKLVKELLPRVQQILADERQRIRSTLDKLHGLMGREINGDDIKIVANAMNDFFKTLNQRGINYPSQLKMRVEGILADANHLADLCHQLEESLATEALRPSLQFYSSNPLGKVSDVVAIITEVQKLAENKGVEFQTNLRNLGVDQGIAPETIDAALQQLDQLIARIEGMEVSNQ